MKLALFGYAGAPAILKENALPDIPWGEDKQESEYSARKKQRAAFEKGRKREVSFDFNDE